MVRKSVILFLASAVACLPELGHAQGQDDTLNSIVRFFSPDLRRTEARLEEIARESKSLPIVKEKPWGSRYGHRSANLPTETTPDWIQISFPESRVVDMVALMPVNLSYRNQDDSGYGFPKRFRIEISENADMSDSVVLVDRSKSDVLNPGKYPMVFKVAPTKGSHVRITSLKHNRDNEGYFWALEEFIVLEGNLVLTGEINNSSFMDLFPLWAPVRVIDGQSTLGMPVDVEKPSATQGYMSAKLSMKEAKDPLAEEYFKWCAIDLGQPELIEQIRLMPLESDEYEVVDGRGYPRNFTLELANDPDFKDVVWKEKRGGHFFGYPESCSVNIRIPQIKARYVRITATAMWSRDEWFVFGFAEIQVFGSNQNLALGKKAFAKDVANKSPLIWSPDFLVDGYTSKYKIISWSEYLTSMSKRGKLESEKSKLEQYRLHKLSLGKKVLGGVSGFVVLLVIAGWIWLLVRHRLLRKREVEEMRQQIARDLHDDIGSNLGGIVLLSEIGSKHSTDEDSRHDFEAIRKAADDASTSMRDIVWLIQRDASGLKDFVTRMRQSLHVILKNHDVSLEVVPEEYRDRQLGLLFRRHVFLSFKEVLNNVRKHAQSSKVSVKIEIKADRLRFTVRDEGIGFDPVMNQTSGYGMNNLKRRASRVSGSIHIISSYGNGTEVIFEAPFSK